MVTKDFYFGDWNADFSPQLRHSMSVGRLIDWK